MNPSNLVYRGDIAESRLGLGKIFHKMGKHTEALGHMRGALELIRPLISEAPDELSWTRNLIRTHIAIGGVLAERGDPDGALQNHRQGLGYAEKMLQRAPSNLSFLRDRAEAWESIGRCYLSGAARPGVPAAKRAEFKAEARSWFQKSLALWQDWVSRNVASPYASRRRNQAAAHISSCDKP